MAVGTVKHTDSIDSFVTGDAKTNPGRSFLQSCWADQVTISGNLVSHFGCVVAQGDTNPAEEFKFGEAHTDSSDEFLVGFCASRDASSIGTSDHVRATRRQAHFLEKFKSCRANASQVKVINSDDELEIWLALALMGGWVEGRVGRTFLANSVYIVVIGWTSLTSPLESGQWRNTHTLVP